MVPCSFQEAEGLIRRSLAIREQAFGPDDVQVASSLSSLATLLRDTMQLQDAEDACRRCLEIRWAPQLPRTMHAAMLDVSSPRRRPAGTALRSDAAGRSHLSIYMDMTRMLAAGLPSRQYIKQEFHE